MPMQRTALVVWLVVCGGGSDWCRAADCNANGVDDQSDLSSEFSVDCNLNGIPDDCEVAPVPFHALTSVPFDESALGVLDVVASDVNGDNIIDLVTVQRGTLSLRLGQEGMRVENYGSQEFEVSSTAFHAQLGDFNSDSNTDLAVFDSSSVQVFSGDGVGGLLPGESIVIGAELGSGAIGDMNGDARSDVVATLRGEGALAVSLSSGAGLGVPTIYASGGDLRGLALIDFDDDGALDVVSVDRAAAVMVFHRGDGTGRLEAAGQQPLAFERPERLLVADVDGDGTDDLLAAGRPGVEVFHRQGPGHFVSAGLLVADMQNNTGVTTLDYDGDGDLDLVGSFVQPLAVGVFANRGDGTFNAGVRTNFEGRVFSVESADIDSDERVDVLLLFFGQPIVTVLWNDASRDTGLSFDPPIEYSTDGDPHTVTIGDFDGDADLDILTGNQDEGLTLLRGRGDGTFEPLAAQDRYTRANYFFLASDDFDSDGDLDIVGVPRSGIGVGVGAGEEGTLFYVTNQGNGLLDPPVQFAVGANPFHIGLGDLDGDLRTDLVTSNVAGNSISVLRNQGAGLFGERQDISVGNGPVAAAVADFDLDGIADIVVANENAAELSIIRGLGENTYSAALALPLPSAPRYVEVADFDQDGYVDVVVANNVSSVTTVWNVLGSLVLGGTHPVHEPPYSLLTTDLNADGLADLVTVSEEGNSMSMLVNAQTREFTLSRIFPIGAGPRFAAAGDLDGNGLNDVIGANRNGRDITVFLNRSASRRTVEFLERLCTTSEFFSLTVPSRRAVRVGKYISPAREDPELLPTIFQNVALFDLHEDFLAQVFPDRFGDVVSDRELYNELVGRRATRDYFVGSISLHVTSDGPLYAFSVFADTGFDFREELTQAEVESVFATLSEKFHLGPLAYQPAGQTAREAAAEWNGVPFRIFESDGGSGFTFEPYTIAVGYGRVRLFDLEAFEAANRSGRFTFQDILIVDQAPRDVEGVVGGVITGQVQGELSHIAVRTARRGTPNAFVDGAVERFRELEGELVRLEVTASDFAVQVVEAAEAEDFWSLRRPSLAADPAIDAEYAALDSLRELDLSAAAVPVSRFGGKATNFARLQRVLTGELARYGEEGFAVPIRHYVEFMRSNTRTVAGREVTYERFLLDLFGSPDFITDSEARFSALDEFRDHARANGTVDVELTAALAEQIVGVFGDSTTMVRFRSSSNVEDQLEFNGAGLYESTSVCARDSIDTVVRQGSHCDPTRTNERTIERALKKVWTSLWTFRAYEERNFFQIPQDLAGMGILVSRAFLDEAANGVAFTGNPSNIDDKRFVVAAQIGEASVVSPEPGELVERNLLELADGEVVRVIRSRRSSLVEPGEHVLSDALLRELGGLMWRIERAFPLSLEGYDPQQVLLDFEFKVESDGSLAVKQVRPFLIASTTPRKPTFELEIPAGAVACAVFKKERDGRPPAVEYEFKATVRFVPGTLLLPAGQGAFAADVFAEVVFGPAMEVAAPLEPGRFEVQEIGDGTETIYRFSFRQEFGLSTGEKFALTLSNLNYRGRGEVPLERSRLIDEDFFTLDLELLGSLDGVPVMGFSSCRYPTLPLFEIVVTTEDGTRITLTERFLEELSDFESAPAALVAAEVKIGGDHRSVTDYFRLVYSAQRHNQDVRYWVVFDSLVDAAGLSRPVHAVEVEAPDDVRPGEVPEEAIVSYLDENFDVIARPRVLSFTKVPIDTAASDFRRGDSDESGTVDLSDALHILNFLFRRGSNPNCLKSADANDDGRLNVTDGVAVLRHLFAAGASLPAPTDCGGDNTSDDLSCVTYGSCP